jgi:hypothetical protein
MVTNSSEREQHGCFHCCRNLGRSVATDGSDNAGAVSPQYTKTCRSS